MANEPEYREILVRINGSEVKLEVNVQSLREALQLPLHPILERGIFDETLIPEMPQSVTENIIDEDHLPMNDLGVSAEELLTMRDLEQ